MDRENLSEEIKDGLSCLGWIVALAVVLGLIAILFRYWDKKDEENYQKYVEMTGKGDSCLRYSNLADAVRYYTEAFEAKEVDTLAVVLMNCELALGNVDAGLKWLDKYADMTFNSDFVELRRSLAMFAKDLDTTKFQSDLDAIIKSPLKLESVSGVREIWDSFWNDDSNYTKKNNYSLYYSGYYAKLIALYNRLGLCKTVDEYFELSENIFKLVEDQDNDHAYIDEYNDLGGTSDIASSLTNHEIRLMNSTGPLSHASLQEKVYIMKWWMFNMYMIDMHAKHGYQAALDHANRATRNNTLNADSDYSYHKYLYGIYLGASEPEKFPTSLTVDEIDKILEYSMDYNGKIPAANFVTMKGAKNFLKCVSLENLREGGDAVLEPVVLLDCSNEFGHWDWKEQTVPILGKNSNAISYINNEFKASDSEISYEVFNARLRQIPTSLYMLNLLQAEYSKQKGLSPYESIVDLKKLIDENSIQ